MLALVSFNFAKKDGVTTDYKQFYDKLKADQIISYHNHTADSTFSISSDSIDIPEDAMTLIFDHIPDEHKSGAVFTIMVDTIIVDFKVRRNRFDPVDTRFI